MLRRAPRRTPSRRATRPARRRGTGPDQATVDLVLERANYSCEVCDQGLGHIRGLDWSIHHRIPRGMGGTWDEDINLPSNLLLVCGSGTSGCHGMVEANREVSHRAGWLVKRDPNPSQVPVLIERGLTWVYLTDDGFYRAATP
jgi:hypothetical protein